jgi:tetratricopeptide (TPR) repeat protein
MNDKRLAQLAVMQAADPDDPFFPYAIAQEYLAGDKLLEAKAEFEALLGRFPDYLPSYYHFGTTLYQLGEAEAALSCWRKGLELAERLGERKTANELRALLEDLGDD